MFYTILRSFWLFLNWDGASIWHQIRSRISHENISLLAINLGVSGSHWKYLDTLFMMPNKKKMPVFWVTEPCLNLLVKYSESNSTIFVLNNL